MESNRTPMPLSCRLLSLIIPCLFLSVQPVLAHEGATGMVKKRMDNMESMKEETKLITDMAKGKRPMDAKQIAQASTKLKELSEHITMQFPKGSLYRPSNALPNIWERWQKFEDYATKLGTEAAQLKHLADQGDLKNARRQIIKLAKNCTGCHKDFRRKKKKTD